MTEQLEQEYCIRCGRPIYDDDPSPFCDDCFMHLDPEESEGAGQ